jgi:hypothetical protein
MPTFKEGHGEGRGLVSEEGESSEELMLPKPRTRDVLRRKHSLLTSTAKKPNQLKTGSPFCSWQEEFDVERWGGGQMVVE